MNPLFFLAALLLLPRPAAHGQDAVFDPNKPYMGYCGRNGTPLQQPNPDLSGRATVSVNLGSAPHARPSLTGLLLGALPAKSGAPATPLAKALPLRLGLWRGDSSDYPLARRTGARFQYIMTNAWGVPLRQGGWTQHRPGGPYDYPKQWAASVAKNASRFSGDDVYMEIWNEPDCPISWNSTPQKLFETYEIAYHALKSSTLGSDRFKIGGLGLNVYNRDYIRAFLDFAVGRRLKVDFISWHEIALTQNDIPSIAGRLKEARNLFLNNLKYQSLGLKEIHINENVGPENSYRPGEILAQQFFLEEGGADKAARSCFMSSEHIMNCRNGSLDGLIVPANESHPRESWFKPRSAWWAYKNYADTFSARIPCRSSNPQVVCFAALPKPRIAKIVLGYFGARRDFPPSSIRLQLSDAPSLSGGNDRLRVNIQRLPDSGEAPLPRPLLVSDSEMPVTGGILSIPLPPLAVHEAWVVTVIGHPKPQKRLRPLKTLRRPA